MLIIASSIILGFLLGSIPFGLLLTKSFGNQDIRTIGSGNIGATNVLRTGRKGLALLTLLLDGGKGAFAVWLITLIPSDQGSFLPLIAGGSAILGHIFSPWLRFKGGKGVATTAGTILALSWPVGVCTILTWAIIAALTRYSSLAALGAATLLPLFSWYFEGGQMAAWAILMTILLYMTHRENIKRLITGKESKIEIKGSPPG